MHIEICVFSPSVIVSLYFCTFYQILKYQPLSHATTVTTNIHRILCILQAHYVKFKVRTRHQASNVYTIDYRLQAIFIRVAFRNKNYYHS